MSWGVMSIDNKRLEFVLKVLKEGYGISESCRRFGISRPTAYKWLCRYKRRGKEGLRDLSRRPNRIPKETSQEIFSAIVCVRNQHPFWGGRTIRGYLRKEKLIKELPHARTIDRILKRHGFVRPRIGRERIVLPEVEIIKPTKCNEVWTTDFKGWWQMQNRRRCYPLTIRDAFCRFLLELGALKDQSFELTKERFISVFIEYGLPTYLLSDNGGPFATTQNIWGLTRLSVWWMKLGIVPLRIEPGKPFQNGAHERMHGDIAQEIERIPEKNWAAEQERFDSWRYDFNYVRPHHALDMKSPGDLYKKSSHTYSGIDPVYVYPSHFEVRSVPKSGQICWGNRQVTFSSAFIGEHIGFETIDRTTMKIWFADFFLGTCDRQFKGKIKPPEKLRRGQAKPFYGKE